MNHADPTAPVEPLDASPSQPPPLPSPGNGVMPPPLPVTAASEDLPADPQEHAEAWAEVEKQQKRQGGFWNAVVIVVITLSLSLGFSAREWTLEKAAMIIGILFVHEMGHYVAMQCFGYRDLRMFFIPFIGAAVTGRNYNVAGWKQALVSLMGPLPGIFVGTIMGMVAMSTQNEWLADLSLLTVGINLVNLLPILPLDGGWFWNAVVFCRHHALEIGFKAFAAVVGILATIADLGGLWMVLGIITLVALPFTYQQGKIAARIRNEGYRSDDLVDDTMPRALGNTIFNQLDQSMKVKLAPSTKASAALKVFERINATPPGALESCGLGGLYALALIVALVGIGCAANVSPLTDDASAYHPSGPIEEAQAARTPE